MLAKINNDQIDTYIIENKTKMWVVSFVNLSFDENVQHTLKIWINLL